MSHQLRWVCAGCGDPLERPDESVLCDECQDLEDGPITEGSMS